MSEGCFGGCFDDWNHHRSHLFLNLSDRHGPNIRLLRLNSGCPLGMKLREAEILAIQRAIQETILVSDTSYNSILTFNHQSSGRSERWKRSPAQYNPHRTRDVQNKPNPGMSQWRSKERSKVLPFILDQIDSTPSKLRESQIPWHRPNSFLSYNN